ncbi:YhgE/Pip domain-containing protein [Nocardiopsis sp. RSe5-2]|uniref:YhgE/Pip domain-containing protein n=1 Tax=Nocardiopsis endophytica TaxID=3018445 RepID=A0ABT4U1M0_9ACTN|nr:YhgE/Pip domain-containing protein [Nocardiopsis endophytica]MDA2810850.1 YhgE/Pip domain-containing protein [Nocardiopsis endophytica]
MKLRKPRALPSLRLGGLSVRSFFRARLTTAAIVALSIVPLLYSGLYLASFWDPFDRMSNLPVALVNEDRPVEVGGEELSAGDEITDELLEGGDLNWKVVDADEAAAGVSQGRYYVSLTIPEDFSERLASPDEDGAEPVPAMLQADFNDANGFTVRQLLTSAFKEVRAAAASTAVADYLDKMFLGFNEIHSKTEEAADGAGKIADGNADAKDGSEQLSNGLDDAKDGSSQLSSGTGELSTGIDQLYDGSKTLADGLGTASQQVSDAADQLNPKADEAIPYLRDHEEDIQTAAEDAQTAANALSEALDGLPDQPTQVQQDAADARAFSDRVAARLEEDPDLQTTDPAMYELLNDAQTYADTGADYAGFVADNWDRIHTVKAKADEVAGIAGTVADTVPGLADKAEDAQDKINDLDEGLQQLADGSRDLRDGLEEASGGAGDLDEGANALDDGIGKLDDGADELDEGLGQLKSGSGELAAGLDEGADAIPTFDSEDREGRGDMMSEPVRLSSDIANEAPQYGTGFAPFFIPLSLWVGAMMIYMVLPPMSGRALASAAPSWRIALAGWVPAAAIGAAQVGISLAALHLYPGLEAERWPATVGLLLLTTAAYTAVVQWANARFGSAGRILALVLLMLQLTSAGGTYPVETSPGFFQAISPYLPMSWVVSALRVLISGGDTTVVVQACGVLAAYTVVFGLLTWLAVARKRMWTMSALHPALKL